MRAVSRRAWAGKVTFDVPEAKDGEDIAAVILESRQKAGIADISSEKRPSAKSSESSATIGYEARLWQMADALRNNMDAAEYKHVVLGLIFLKYISDVGGARRDVLTLHLGREE